MFVGDVNARSKADIAQFRQLTYTCMNDTGSRSPETANFPTRPCPYGIMANVRFPTCWDGVNLDSPDHMAHMSYPESGTFESQGPCPASHPVRMPQVLFEVVWDTKQFNNPADWPTDGTQPFVWSFGDATGKVLRFVVHRDGGQLKLCLPASSSLHIILTVCINAVIGFANHADYVFGWKNDALQKLMDTACVVNCGGLTQNTAAMNKCTQKAVVNENVDGCKSLYRCVLAPQ